MYQLYYSPGSCSLIIHFLLEELGVPYELKRVDTEKKEHQSAGYRKLNPKGKVPVMVTPEGPITECVAIAQYLCDRHDPGHRLLAAPGTWRRSKQLEQVAMLATEIHNNLFNRFFHADAMSADEKVQGEIKADAARKLGAFFREEDARLTGDFWNGRDGPDLADLFFMVMARWGRWLDPPALRMRNIEPYYRRMSERPAMAKAFADEGIKPFGT